MSCEGTELMDAYSVLLLQLLKRVQTDRRESCYWKKSIPWDSNKGDFITNTISIDWKLSYYWWQAGRVASFPDWKLFRWRGRSEGDPVYGSFDCVHYDYSYIPVPVAIACVPILSNYPFLPLPLACSDWSDSCLFLSGSIHASRKRRSWRCYYH